MNKGEGFDITILHLAKPENNDKDLDFYFLLTQLSIPDDIQKFVFQTMFHRGYIEANWLVRKKLAENQNYVNRIRVKEGAPYK